MRQPLKASSLVVVFAAMALTAACTSSSGPDLDRRLVAGVYTLQSVTGRGPTSGTVILAATGRAERTVSYPAEGTDTMVYGLVGTYSLGADGFIHFAFRDVAGSTDYTWHIVAERQGSGFTIQYPDAADGPNIVEFYERM